MERLETQMQREHGEMIDALFKTIPALDWLCCAPHAVGPAPQEVPCFGGFRLLNIFYCPLMVLIGQYRVGVAETSKYKQSFGCLCNGLSPGSVPTLLAE